MANYRTMKRIKEWKFPRSEPYDKHGNPNQPWVVTHWENGTYSCTCPIWCQLRQPDSNGNRSCKHLRGVVVMEMVDMNIETQGRKAVSSKPVPPAVPKPKGWRIILEDE